MVSYTFLRDIKLILIQENENINFLNVINKLFSEKRIIDCGSNGLP